MIDVSEAANGSWGSTREYRIDVYGTIGAGDNLLLGSLFVKNATADGASIENVELTIDLGSATAIPDTFDVIVTRTAS